MLTRKMLVQAASNGLAGWKVEVNIRRLDEPWRIVFKALDEAPSGEEHEYLVHALQHFDNWQELLGEIVGTPPGTKFGDFPSLEELAKDLLPIDWLWKNYIPRAMLTLMGAAPGVGKSNICLDLADRAIDGKPWPDGQPNPTTGANVIYVDAEAVPQVINERAVDWGMNRSRLFMLLPDDDLLDLGAEKYRNKLVEMTGQIQPALIIIDSLSSISRKGENNIEDIRTLLAFLNALAQDYNTALILIHHLRKGSVGQMKTWDVGLDDFRGSGHIVAMSRSVIGITLVQTEAETDRNGPRKFEVIKTNLGPYPKPLGFEVLEKQPAGLQINWLEKPPQVYKEPSKQDTCVAWLEGLLRSAKKPLKPGEIEELGVPFDFGRAMIYRARDILADHIENTGGRQSPNNAWAWKD